MVLVCVVGWGQTFEVASVKVAVGGRLASGGGPGTADPERWTCTVCRVAALLSQAYEIRPYQLAAPDWVTSDTYDVAVKIPPGTTRAEFRVMLQHLLAERFKMTVHREPREIPVYQLVVAKSGIRMADTSAGLAPEAPGTQAEFDRDGYPNVQGGTGFLVRNGRGKMQFRQQTMANVANALTGWVDRPVIDATGLTGKYALTLAWIPESRVTSTAPAPAGPIPQASVPEGPNIFQAVQDQLGLRLEAKKGTVDMLVVDRAERHPVEN